MAQKPEKLNQQEAEVQGIPVNNPEEDRVKPAELVLSAERKNGYEKKVASLEDGDARKVLAEVIQLIEQKMDREKTHLKEALGKAPEKVKDATGTEPNGELSGKLETISEKAEEAKAKCKKKLDAGADFYSRVYAVQGAEAEKVQQPQAAREESNAAIVFDDGEVSEQPEVVGGVTEVEYSDSLESQVGVPLQTPDEHEVSQATSEQEQSEVPDEEISDEQRYLSNMNAARDAFNTAFGAEDASFATSLLERIDNNEDNLDEVGTIIVDEEVDAWMKQNNYQPDDVYNLLREYEDARMLWSAEVEFNNSEGGEQTEAEVLFNKLQSERGKLSVALGEGTVGDKKPLTKALVRLVKNGEEIATILEDEKVLARLQKSGQTADSITPLLEDYKTKYDEWSASAEIDQLKTEQPVENTAQNKEAAEQAAETSAEVALDSRQIQGVLDAAAGYVAGIKNKSIRRKAEMALGGLSANADPDTVFPAIKRALGMPSSTSDARFLQRISRLRVDTLQDQVSNSRSENARRRNDALNREINAVLERSKRLGVDGVSDDEARAIYTGQDNQQPSTPPSSNTGKTPSQPGTQQRSSGVSMQRRFGKAHEPRKHTTDAHVGKTTLPLGETKGFKPGDRRAQEERLIPINRTEQQAPEGVDDQSPDVVVDTEPLEPLKPQEEQPVMWTESEQRMQLEQAQKTLEYWQGRVNQTQERIINAETDEEKVRQSKILQTHMEQVAHYEAAVAEAQRVVNEVPAGSDALPNESPVENNAPEEFTAEDVDRTAASVSEVAESVAGEQEASQVVESETVNDTENEDSLDSIHPEALMFKPTAADNNIDGRKVIEYYIQNTTTTDKLSTKKLVDALLQYKQEGASGMGQFATEHITDDQMTKITSALDSAYQNMLTEQKAESASAEI